MAQLLDKQVEYNKQGLNELQRKLRRTERRIEQSQDLNKIVKLLDYKYALEEEIKLYKRNYAATKQIAINTDTGQIIRLSDLINENFYEYFKCKSPYRILKGGRSSFKSSVVSLKLVTKFLQDDKANMIMFRKVGKYLSTSIYEQIKWAILILGAQGEFTFLKSPLKIIHNKTKTAFYFYGVDDPMKIKSAKIAEGYVTDLWFEEAAEFDGKEEIDTVTDTFIRQDLPGDMNVEVTFTYNPPRNPYVWINEWLEEIKHDNSYYIHHSTYEDDKKGFLSEQFLDKVRKIKVSDPEYHDWMYLGKVIGLGDIVYNIDHIQKITKIPDNDKLLFADVAIDTGYSISATTFLFIGYTLKGNIILLDTYYYSPRNKTNKKAPSEFSKDLWEFITKNATKWDLNVDTETIDSAEAGLRNQYAKDYGRHLRAAKKKDKESMIEDVINLFVQGRFYMLDTDNNKVFYEEHKKYQWDADTLEPNKQPKVIKVDDHTCDAFQYYVQNNLIKLGMK